ncbi:PKD domain-containing protein [Chitinophaga sp.]|uniref:PKD domain-containing protein n=1 Tax=Chitinophaga sp. TaxID=1869181 RepID=UPI0031CF0F3A
MIDRLRVSYWRAYPVMLLLVLLGTIAPAFAQNVTFTASKESGCAPLTVSFTNGSDAGALSYSWDFGNGGSGTTTRDADRLFLDPGSYTVTLTVTYPGGPKTFSRTITVHENPVPEFAVSATTGCTPLQVQFTDQSAPGSGTISSVVWDFGDGLTSQEASPVHTYNIGGSFSISTIVTNSFGCSKGLTKTRLITVGETPQIDFTANTTSSCSTPLPVTFYSSGPAGLTYTWDFGDPASGAANTSAEQNPSHEYTQEGRYTVTLVARTAEGCEAVVTKQSYIVIEKTKADFNVLGPACAGSLVTLENTTMPRPQHSTWTLPDGSTSSATNAVYMFSAPGDYEVTLYTGLPGCMETVTKTVTVHQPPVAEFSASPLTSCSVPFSTQFSSESQGATAWQWTFGDGTTSAAESPSHTYQQFGNYAVTLRVTNAQGCAAVVSKPQYIQVPEPSLQINRSAQEGCLPLDVSFSASLRSVGTITSWHWDFGDGTTSTEAQPTHTYTTQGQFIINLTAELAGGCRIVRQSIVSAGEIPVVDFDANPKTPCANELVRFENLSQPRGTEWLWTFHEDGATSTQENPQREFRNIGQHSVTLMVNNYGCRRSLTKTDFITLKPPVANFGFTQSCADRYTVTFRDVSNFGPVPGPEHWQWSFGDGATSTEQHPVHVYAAPGLYTVRLTVNNESCESNFERQVLIIDEKPVVYTDKAAICAGTPVVVTRDALNEANIRNWYWNWGDNSYSPNPGDAINKTYTQPGTYQITLEITDLNGCVNTSAPVTVQVNGAMADFSFSGRNCRNDEITFTDASTSTHGNTITGWSWNFGDGTPVEAVTVQPLSHKHAFANIGTYNVQLHVTDNAGCETTVTKPVPVTGVTADFRSAGPIACLDQEMLFSNLSTGANLQYAWNFGDNTTSTEAHPLKPYSQPGRYTVALTVTGGPGCTATMVKDAYIHVPDPQARFSVPSNLAECPPVLVQTTNQSTDFVRSVWDFGDGSRSSVESPSHVYNIPGTYTISLQVYSEGDCMSSVSKSVKIDGPTGTSNWTPESGCLPLGATFTASSPNAVKYIWDFDNGTVQTTATNTVQYTYGAQGVYTPRVILEDAKGCQVPAQSSGPNIIVDGVNAAFSVDDSRACDAGEVFFTDLSTGLSKDRLGQPHTFRWDFGYASRTDDVSNQQNPSFLYQGVGTYTARVEVTTAYGCTDAATGTVTVEALPEAVINPVGPVCEGDSIRLSGRENKNLPGTHWQWVVDGQPYNGPHIAPRLAFSSAGLHVVQLVITNENNKCPNTATANISVNPLPSLNVSPRLTNICLGQSLQLQSNAGNAQVSWTDYNISNASAANPTVSPERDTVYRVQAINQFGCIRQDAARVTVSQPFTVRAADAVMCSGRPTQLHASGAVSYRWLPATGLSRADVASPLASPATTTQYRVVGYGRDNCFTDTASVLLTVNPSPDIRATPIEVAAGTSVPLHVQGGADVTQWSWYPNQWISCADCPAPVVTPKGDVTYNITATNSYGCQTIALLPVKLVCPGSTAFIPNSFSPNGDGQNDVFYVRGGGISAIKSFKIFNRWGQLMFERVNCNTDDVSCGWDGRFNGKLLPPDVYIYFAELTCDTNEPLLLKGNVTLLR